MVVLEAAAPRVNAVRPAHSCTVATDFRHRVDCLSSTTFCVVAVDFVQHQVLAAEVNRRQIEKLSTAFYFPRCMRSNLFHTLVTSCKAQRLLLLSVAKMHLLVADPVLSQVAAFKPIGIGQFLKRWSMHVNALSKLNGQLLKKYNWMLLFLWNESSFGCDLAIVITIAIFNETLGLQHNATFVNLLQTATETWPY